jgi:hypothetical protein
LKKPETKYNIETPLYKGVIFILRSEIMKVQKKVLGFTVAVIAIAAFFGCSYPALEEETETKVDEQGRRIVEFSVPTQTYETVLGGGGDHKSFKFCNSSIFVGLYAGRV